jgi:hypothetical protein
MFNFIKNLPPLFLIVFLLSSCTNSDLNTSTPVDLNFPEAESYYSLVIRDGTVVVLVNDGESGQLGTYAKENDQEFTEFVFVENTDCSSTRSYDSYETLPDGRLQIWKWCLTGKGGVDYLLAYDWETQQLEKIAGPLPLDSSGASWNPDQTQAIAYLDSNFATRTLYWIYPGDFETLDLEIKHGSRSWNLKDDFPKFDASKRGESGSTGRASWSPDGKQIAFFASPVAIGKTGFSRFRVEYYLYLLDPETLQYEVVADNIFSPFVLSWSPDATHIAFIGKRGFWKENGIWLYSIKDNTVTSISEGIYQSIVWRSDTSVVAIQCEELSICRQVVEFDILSILEE